jgi:predicted aminopeptidase
LNARRLAALTAALLLAGCGAMEAAEYYMQSAGGQLDLIGRAKPISEVIAQTPDAALKQRLLRVQAMRAFASAELGLPDNASYTRYSDLERPFVVWNVFATPELSLQPRQWCFPVAGCVSYRGYFREEDARAEALRLHAEGADVAVTGVPAYSTLGYFDDPVLSTFVRWPEPEVARMIFHELAHQVTYVKDDTTFNESFAVAVEEAGLDRWLRAEGNAAMTQYRARSQTQRAAFRELTLAARVELAAVYASAATDEVKRERKAQVLAAMRQGYERAKAGEPGLAGYDRWFAGFGGAGPNNASLASTALYSAQVPAFRALLAEEGGDLPRFYERVKVLAALPKAERMATLRRIAPE